MDLRINSMGTAVGDYNNDGLMDYYFTNIRANCFMVNQGAGKPFINREQKELGTEFMAISWEPISLISTRMEMLISLLPTAT